MSLKPVLEAWNKIAEEPSTNKKEELIKESIVIEHFAKATFLALNTMLKFKTREIWYEPVGNTSVNKIWEVLQHLSTKSGADAADKQKLSEAASIDEETVEAVNRILKGDLRCGAGRTLFRKYITSIPKHAPMLCIDDLDKFIKTAGSFDNIATSIKLDGVRVWAIVEESGIKYLSRNGKEYPNFEIFDTELREKANTIVSDGVLSYPMIFDGEVCSRDKDFQRCLSNFRKLKEADTSIFDFSIFDVVDNRPLIERYKIITKYFPKEGSRVNYLPHMFGMMEDKEEILELLNTATKDGEEGLLLKTMDGPYEFKRSNHWCKLKRFLTEDLTVVGLELGTGKNVEVLGALICDRDGIEIKVGSGFTDLERKEFLEDPPEVIEVKYQSTTKDGSLRFPIFMKVREDI